MRYNPALDGFRAVAILAVAAGHCQVPYFRGGFIGVDIFFVLSGYLITGLLVSETERTERIAFGRFYLNRALRLMPPLLLMLLAYVSVGHFMFPDADIGRTALAALFYVSDMRPLLQLTPDPIGHTWSLGVEEKFYLIWPLAFLFIMRLRRAQAVWVVAGLFAACAIWRVAMASIAAPGFRVAYGFDTNAAGLMLGALLTIMPWRPSRTVTFAAAIFAMFGLAVAVSAFRFQDDGPGTVMAFIMTTAVIGATEFDNAITRALSWKPLVTIGTLSYSIYLWHYPMARFLRQHLSPELTFPVVMFASVLIAAASWHFMERPLKSFRHRIAGRAPALAPAE